MGKPSKISILKQELEQEVAELRAGRTRENNKIDAEIDAKESLIERLNGKQDGKASDE